MSKNGQQQTVSQTEPYEGAQGALNDALFAAQGEFRAGPPQYYPGSTVVGRADATQQALDLARSRGQQGMPGASQAFGFAQNAMTGGSDAGAGHLRGQSVGMGGFTPAGFVGNYGGTASPRTDISGTALGYADQLAAAGQAPTTAGVGTLGGASVSGNADARAQIQGLGQAPISAGLDTFRNMAQGTGVGAGTINQFAQGGGAQNTDAVRDRIFDQVTNQTKATFAAAGRDLDASELSAGLLNAYAPFALNQGNVDANRQLSAAGQAAGLAAQGAGQLYGAASADNARATQSLALADQMRLGNQAQQMQAANSLAGIQAGDRAAAMSGLGGAANTALGGLTTDTQFGFSANNMAANINAQNQALIQSGAMANQQLQNQQLNRQMQGLGALGAADDYRNRDIGLLSGVGAANESLAGQYLNEDMARFNYGQNANRENIQWLNAIATGQGSMGGSYSQGSQGPAVNPFLQGASGATAGAGLGSMFGPYGTAIGAGLGGLFGVLG